MFNVHRSPAFRVFYLQSTAVIVEAAQRSYGILCNINPLLRSRGNNIKYIKLANSDRDHIITHEYLGIII